MGIFLQQGLNPFRRLNKASFLNSICCISIVFSGAIFPIGCGMAAAPQPPSLNLPKPVNDLAATRAGNQVSLHWNAPKENTDKLKIRGPVQFRICRQDKTSPCQTIATVSEQPGKPADYTDVLPLALVRGPLRKITYQILGINKHGRSAGPSNGAAVLAGEAPPPILDLSATVLERGVVLHWLPVAGLPADTHIQLVRTLLTPQTPKSNQQTKSVNPVPAPTEPTERTLLVNLSSTTSDPGTALDTSAEFGQTYRYVASRITEYKIDKQVLQVASPPSAPVTILTRDTFPPSAPTGLAAVPVSAAINGGEPEVDLSWSSNTEPDLAQYRVYRRDVAANGSVAASKQRIAPENATELVMSPAFQDTHVQAGHTYAYSVTAVDNAGNESAESKAVEVTVPTS